MTDSDIDPIAEIRAVREKISLRFKTMDAYFDFLRTVPPADVLLAQIRGKTGKPKARPARRPASRRRKAPVHA